tara:strand:+ start:3689 stop:4678 length:990 start_codon:yes stop_codon:yes gene_type:complete
MIIYICSIPKKIIYSGNIIKQNNFKTELFQKSQNFNIQICDYNNIQITENNIYLFIKDIPDYIIPVMKELKKKGNYLIYEPLDEMWCGILNGSDIKDATYTINSYMEYMIPIFNLFDHIIFNNKSFLKNKYIKNLQINKNIIYHEYDARLLDTNKKIQNQIFYIGSIKKSSFIQESYMKIIKKYNINIVTLSDIRIDSKDIKKDKYSQYKQVANINNLHINLKGIHIDYVKPNKLYYYIHTATKLSTCLALDSIFISNRIPVFVELLGKKYDLFFKDDLSDLHEIINKAYDILQNTNKYLDYLKKMAPIKKRLSLHNSSKQYYDIFKSI